MSVQAKVEVSYMEIYNEKVYDLLDLNRHILVLISQIFVCFKIPSKERTTKDKKKLTTPLPSLLSPRNKKTGPKASVKAYLKTNICFLVFKIYF